jgi:hypothetical protein
LTASHPPPTTPLTTRFAGTTLAHALGVGGAAPPACEETAGEYTTAIAATPATSREGLMALTLASFFLSRDEGRPYRESPSTPSHAAAMALPPKVGRRPGQILGLDR